MRTTDEAMPRIGDWFVPRDGSNVGICVDVLLDGTKVILARRMLDGVVETVHRTIDLKGPLLGQRVVPNNEA